MDTEIKYAFFAVILSCILFVFLRGASVKKLFGVKWYVIFIGGDIGGRTPYRINKSILNGCPDAVFFDLLRLRFVVGEYKSRTSNYGPTQRELNQIQLYLGIINKWYLSSPIGFLAYGSGKVCGVSLNKKKFKAMYKKRFELLKIMRDF